MVTVETTETPSLVDLDAAYARLHGGIERLPDFCPVVLPTDLTQATGSYAGKTLELRAVAFRARGVRYGRLVRIDGPGTWILNAVVFPEDGYTFPILGIELLVFRERMHLIVADLFPLEEQDEGVMDDLAPHFDQVGTPPEMPTWARNIFSRRPIFRKPGSTSELTAGARAVDAVSFRWLARVHDAAPAARAALAAEARRRRDAYICAHVEDEPAHPFLGKAFGAELGERLVSVLLFPARGGPTPAPPRR